MKNEVLTALRNNGHEVELREITKNNVTLTGFEFKIGDGTVRPVLYLENYISDCKSVDEIVNAITNDIVKVSIPGFAVSEFMTADFCKANIRIGLQRDTEENIVKSSSDYAGIEKYLYIRIDDNATFKIKTDYLERVGISEADAWNIALKNTCDDVIIKNLSDELGIPDFIPMWVISNKSKLRGAAAILATDKVKKFASDNGFTSLIVIPSSIHECILVSDELSLADISQMVKDTNSTLVDPTEQLSDTAYFFK